MASRVRAVVVEHLTATYLPLIQVVVDRQALSQLCREYLVAVMAPKAVPQILAAAQAAWCRIQAAPVLLLFATLAHSAAQAARSLPLAGTHTIPLTHLGHIQHEPLCPN
jgi:hypothetical protein